MHIWHLVGLLRAPQNNAVAIPGKLWPGGIVPYHINPNTCKAKHIHVYTVFAKLVYKSINFSFVWNVPIVTK